MRRLFTLLTLGLLFALPAKSEILTLEWDDLRPEAERHLPLMPENPHAAFPFADESEFGPMDWTQKFGAVVPEINGKQVRVPGFVVPLEGTQTHVTEFLLVPYFGACLHAPPPPPNQTIYVVSEEPIKLSDLAQAVWIEGTLQTEVKTSELADAAYVVQLDQLEEYY